MIRGRSLPKVLLISVILAAVYSLPAQSPVPEDLPPLQKAELQKRYLVILALATKINGMVDHLESTCKGVRSDDGPTLARCAGEQQAIRDVKQRWKEMDDPYEHDLKAAIIANAIFVSKGPAVDLAKNPAIVESSKQRLELINARIERIEKAIRVLGEENPEWEKEMERLREQMMETNKEGLFSSLDFLSFAVLERIKVGQELNLERIEKVLHGDVYKELMAHKQFLMKIAGAKNLDATISNLARLESAGIKALANAELKKDAAAAAASAREFGVLYYETAHKMAEDNKVIAGRDVLTDLQEISIGGTSIKVHRELFRAATLTGAVGIALVGVPVVGAVSAPVAATAVVGTAVSKLADVTYRLKNIYDEHQQMTALTNQAESRAIKAEHLKLIKADLQQEAQELKARIIQAQGLK